MLLFSQLLFLCAIQSICSKPHNFERDSREVDKLIGKILHANRFNELADVIAERAVVKLNDLQQPNYTANYVNKNIVYRSPKSRTDENLAVKVKGQKNHIHGNIDIDAVLKHKVLPIDDLHLRYKLLKQKKTNIGRSHKIEDSQEKDTYDKAFIINREENNKRHESDKILSSLSSENKNYQKIAEEIKLDFDENIKTRSDEMFNNPFGNGETIPWSKKLNSRSPFETDLTLRNQSEKRRGQDEKPKVRFRTEGNKTFTFEQSPDYKEYHEQLAKVTGVVALGLDV